jgi:hypothetical protein
MRKIFTPEAAIKVLTGGTGIWDMNLITQTTGPVQMIQIKHTQNIEQKI